MVKTAPMDDKTHTFFKKTQLALFEKYKIKVTISDMMADLSYALRHPEEAAKIILRARHIKHGDVISSEGKLNDSGIVNDKDSGINSGLLLIDHNNGDSESESVSSNILKPIGITLVEKEDVKT